MNKLTFVNNFSDKQEVTLKNEYYLFLFMFGSIGIIAALLLSIYKKQLKVVMANALLFILLSMLIFSFVISIVLINNGYEASDINSILDDYYFYIQVFNVAIGGIFAILYYPYINYINIHHLLFKGYKLLDESDDNNEVLKESLSVKLPFYILIRK